VSLLYGINPALSISELREMNVFFDAETEGKYWTTL
jgi:hypothetical protein